MQIDGSIIGDGEIPPPQIGSVIRLPLRFIESSPFDGDGATVRALLKPSDRDPILQYTGVDSPRRWEWNGLLHGDGWTASWRGFRPRTGQVELTGRFFADWGYDTAGRARGRVTRVQLVRERYRLRSGSQGSWEQVPGYRTLRDVEAAPRFFDNSMFTQESGEVDHEVGALVELDLDGVPELPTRSGLVPGDVSASGELLWVADCELPLVVSLDAEHVPTEHILPGPIGPARSLWATPTGCWVGGEDGTYHCTADGTPRRVDNLSVVTGAVAGETFLSCTSGSTWVLHRPDQQPIELTAPDGYVTSIAVDDGDFVVLLRHLDSSEQSGIRLVRVDPCGSMTIGPVLAHDPGPERPYLTGPPLRVFRGENVWRVAPDLDIGSAQRLPRSPLQGGQIGDYVWIVGHPPDGTGSSGWWPLPGPTEYDPTRQFWLFTLLDATTLEPLKSTPIFTTQPRVTIDSANTVWVAADGVRAIPVETMQWPERLDVAARLDSSRRSSSESSTV